MRKRIKIPPSVKLVNLINKKPFKVLDEDAPKHERIYDPKGRQVGPLKDQDEVFDHYRVVFQFILNDEKFAKAKGGQQYETWRAGRRIAKALDDATDKALSYYDLRADDQERMVEVVKSWHSLESDAAKDQERMPQKPWENTMVMMQLMEHFEAILGAEDVEGD